jgi:hypothetical protein
MTTRLKIDGITYDAAPTGMKNIHTKDPIYTLTKIGKRGKPVKQYRPAILRKDGTYKMGAWIYG